ncbi:MAG: SHOCT domain-containing protein [Bacilli bacterium]|jgi:uncharacterized membrane protein|nr:SHOCT domain-containing protein [Bacilli bacterium]
MKHRVVRIAMASAFLLLAIIFFVALVVPAFSYTMSGSNVSKEYLIALLGTTVDASLTGSGTSASESVNMLYGIVAASLFLIGPALFVFSDNKATKVSGYAISIAVFAISVVLCDSLKDTFKQFIANDIDYSNGGYVMLIIFMVLLLIVLVADVFFSFFFDDILNSVKKSKSAKNAPERSLEDRLVELKGLLDKKLISQDEYDAKRQEMLK